MEDVILAEARFGEDRVMEAWTLLKKTTKYVDEKERFDGSLPIEILQVSEQCLKEKKTNLINRSPNISRSTLQGNSCEILAEHPADHFDVVVHDPPARALCNTDLYGLRFYKDLHRCLKKPGGVLFHYIGNPSSKESGGLYKG